MYVISNSISLDIRLLCRVCLRNLCELTLWCGRPYGHRVVDIHFWNLWSNPSETSKYKILKGRLDITQQISLPQAVCSTDSHEQIIFRHGYFLKFVLNLWRALLNIQTTFRNNAIDSNQVFSLLKSVKISL